MKSVKEYIDDEIDLTVLLKIQNKVEPQAGLKGWEILSTVNNKITKGIVIIAVGERI